MAKCLDKKWKEFVFALACFGPNFLMVLMGAYFTDAINPVALGAAGGGYQAIVSGVCLISPVLFPILYMIARVFDGIIDVPLAHVTDNLKTKWGKRRPTIAVCLIPMIVSFAMCWWPIGGENNQLLNTIWIICWSLVFFVSYTLCMLSFYGSIANVCADEGQRSRVSAYKAFFDTISYVLVYALIPLMLDAFKIHIDKFTLCCLPLMLTMVTPLFIVKEGKKYGYPEREGVTQEKVGMIESIKSTFKSNSFRPFLIVNACTMFGMQMFLVAMNAMIVGGMNFKGFEMTIINTCAFAPIPVMLYLFNKVKAKKGVRFTYQTCLVCFALAIMSFFASSNFVLGFDNKILQYIIAGGGGIIGSWAIGAFFMLPILAPAQISSVEEKLTGKNNSAMYFAANSVLASVAGSIASTVVYENIKMLFINKTTGQIIWAESLTLAAQQFGVAENVVFNFGTMLVPFVVSLFCFIAFIVAFKMPKDFTPECIAKVLKKTNPSLDVEGFLAQNGTKKEAKGEIIFIQIGLSILSGFIFGIIWIVGLCKSIKEFFGKSDWWMALLSCIIPFFAIYYLIKTNKQLIEKSKEMGVEVKNTLVADIILSVFFPLLFLNVVSLSLMQSKINKLYQKEFYLSEAVANA